MRADTDYFTGTVQRAYDAMLSWRPWRARPRSSLACPTKCIQEAMSSIRRIEGRIESGP